MGRIFPAPTLAALLAGCSNVPHVEMSHLPTLPHATPVHRTLAGIAAPDAPITVAVYGFADQTGQFKPSDTTQSLSRAVTQGGASILTKALSDAGGGAWFQVLEREQLKDLLTERQIVTEMRQRYAGEDAVNKSVLPAMLYAGVLLEGGIISYDTASATGGVGANLLGIGGDVKYRQDTVSVYLRAVSVKTGQVLLSVQTAKTIASTGVQASTFRFVAVKELLQGEAGFTTNEPSQVALQQAIEKAVVALILEGSEKHLWRFADPAAAAPILARYDAERDGLLAPETLARVEDYERRRAHTVQTR